jgi:hypothetical protein
MTAIEISRSLAGACASKHTAQALKFRIQRPNSRQRSYAFVVHQDCYQLFQAMRPRLIGAEPQEVSTETIAVYLSSAGYIAVDTLFTVDPPDFLTLIAPADPLERDKFLLVVRRLTRWMHNRFVTTLLWTNGESVQYAHASPELIGELRSISSQLVWVEDAVDLEDILRAMRIAQ